MRQEDRQVGRLVDDNAAADDDDNDENIVQSGVTSLSVCRSVQFSTVQLSSLRQD